MYVGIDLGTTYSLVSKYGTDGNIELIPDSTFRDSFFTPSVVHIDRSNAYVGQTVQKLLEQKPELEVLRFFKRSFGVHKPLHFGKDSAAWYPEGIAALLLKKLQFDVQAHTMEDVKGAVITVPAHFTDKQRKSVLQAANLVDLEVIGLIDEPVAAAIHYGVNNDADQKAILVYDFGGGTFDCTIIEMHKDGVNVLSKDGHTELGGKEMDEKIGSIILDQYVQSYGKMPDLNARSLLQLRSASEEIKIELGLPSKKFLTKTVFIGNQPLQVAVTRPQFEEKIQPLIEKSIRIVQRCIDDSSLDKEDIDTVILVGGTSMIPAVQNAVRSYFSSGKQEVIYHDPMKAVASGAALHVCQLNGDAIMAGIPSELNGVTGYSVGIRTLDSDTGRVAIDELFRKNTALPIELDRTYYTIQPKQTKMLFDFIQYRQENDPHSMGSFILDDLPAETNYPVGLKVSAELNGTIKVCAYDSKTGRELKHVLTGEEEVLEYLVNQKRLVKSTIVNHVG